jgi:Cys-tRNA(Pro)/Cys-tRNA(Cys) deacylase
MHPNVHAALESGKISYINHLHTSYNTPINSPADFALALGYDIGRITKSVFVRSTDKEKYAMAVCSIDKKLNFQILARQLACNKVEVAGKDELQQLVGYPQTGVSPLGLINIPVYLDEGLLCFKTILIGAGIAGEEIELSPRDLLQACGATLLNMLLL